jgi:hypothetical protein
MRRSAETPLRNVNGARQFATASWSAAGFRRFRWAFKPPDKAPRVRKNSKTWQRFNLTLLLSLCAFALNRFDDFEAEDLWMRSLNR